MAYVFSLFNTALCLLCTSLQLSNSVLIVLISFVDFDIIRKSFYTASNLKDLFHNIHPKQITFLYKTLVLLINLKI